MTRPRRPRTFTTAVGVAVGTLLLGTALLGGRLDATTPQFTDRLAAPSTQHLLGTDQLGRDVLVRLVAASRLSVGFTFVALLLCALIGTAAGMTAAWRGGVVGQVVLAGVDVLNAIPTVVIALVLVAVLEPGPGALLTAVLAAGWTPFARLAHQLTVREAGADYVVAAVVLGATTRRVVVRDILPNLARPLLANACLRYANVLLVIAGLSFLGLGPQPPTPEWGLMLAEAQPFLTRAPLLTLAPASAIVLVSVVVTTLGRRLQRRWDASGTIGVPATDRRGGQAGDADATPSPSNSNSNSNSNSKYTVL